MYAAFYGYTDVEKFLLKHGAKVSAMLMIYFLSRFLFWFIITEYIKIFSHFYFSVTFISTSFPNYRLTLVKYIWFYLALHVIKGNVK